MCHKAWKSEWSIAGQRFGKRVSDATGRCAGINTRSRYNVYAQYNREAVQGSVLFPVRTKLQKDA
jgi:hypothetical protein